MNPENTTKKRRSYTDDDRDNALKLIGHGLSHHEVARMLGMYRVTVDNVARAYDACLKQDWSTLQKLSTTCKATVSWAMKKTGTDEIFARFFPKDDVPDEPTPVVAPTPDPAPTITREEFAALNTTLQDICYLLTEIRDALK